MVLYFIKENTDFLTFLAFNNTTSLFIVFFTSDLKALGVLIVFCGGEGAG